MPTVSDLLQQMLEGNTQEPDAEKTAAETSSDDQYEKIAKELNLSPEEIEAATNELEGLEKKAEAEKKADEAVLLGRFMARGFVDELQKVGSGTPVVNKGGGKAVAQQADAMKRHCQTPSPLLHSAEPHASIRVPASVGLHPIWVSIGPTRIPHSGLRCKPGHSPLGPIQPPGHRCAPAPGRSHGQNGIP